ncbi:MAG: hypothetical protein P4L67_02705 [Candidatus Pacebacteria bacterium]|nr:hypothetical protein [Candidatus Paceibacterota bacterium]
MKVATAVVWAFLFGSAAVAVPQGPQQASGVDGKQYAIMTSVLDAPRQSYEKNCQFFYWSKVLGDGNELVGFRFTRNGVVERPVVRIKNLSIAIDEKIQSPTAQEVSTDGGGHYILRMNGRDHGADGECLAGIALMR